MKIIPLNFVMRARGRNRGPSVPIWLSTPVTWTLRPARRAFSDSATTASAVCVGAFVCMSVLNCATCTNSDSVEPGHRHCTVTPAGRSSSERASENASTKAFVAA